MKGQIEPINHHQAFGAGIGQMPAAQMKLVQNHKGPYQAQHPPQQAAAAASSSSNGGPHVATPQNAWGGPYSNHRDSKGKGKNKDNQRRGNAELAIHLQAGGKRHCVTWLELPIVNGTKPKDCGNPQVSRKKNDENSETAKTINPLN